jgi:hypothetical protein
MNSQRLWSTIGAVLALSTLGPRSTGVWAQDAICPSGFSWNQNSLGQDPCTVAADLESSCRSETYEVPPLGSTGDYYIPPQSTNAGDLQCECNTVVYSLYEACTSCQGGLILSWTNWSTSCTNIDVAGLPYTIPSGTDVPHWAFYDVTKLPGETYTDANAMAIGRDPQNTPGSMSVSSVSSVPSVSSGTPTRPLPSPSSVSEPPSPSSTSSGNGPNPNGNTNSGSSIVGGFVGSVVPLSIFAAVVALIL